MVEEINHYGFSHSNEVRPTIETYTRHKISTTNLQLNLSPITVFGFESHGEYQGTSIEDHIFVTYMRNILSIS